MIEAVFAQGLTKAYNGKTVVDHLNLSVKSGTVFGLLGANGAGKSTTIECILGTKQADAGTVRLLGQAPGKNRRALLERVGVLVGGVARDTKQASVLALVLYFPMLVFSGTTLPLEVMPRTMLKLVSLFPLTQGITMMKNAFIGADTGSVLLPVCVMLGLTVLCTAFSVRFFRWE